MCTLLACKASTGLKQLMERGEEVDAVLFDPPFEMGKGATRARMTRLASKRESDMAGTPKDFRQYKPVGI